MGTGFYINGDGDVVTASHVLGERQFLTGSDGQLRTALNLPARITIKQRQGKFVLPASAVDGNAANWANDLAIIRTRKATKCWLAGGNDSLATPGEHLIAMGFPALAFDSLSLYNGILSAKLKSGLVIGQTSDGQPVWSSSDFLRVHVPLSPGISGAPIIDDQNRAIRVISSAGAWSQDLERLLKLQQSRDSSTSTAPTLDLFSLTAHLAEIFHNFASPGYGDAVPLSYLVSKAEHDQRFTNRTSAGP